VVALELRDARAVSVAVNDVARRSVTNETWIVVVPCIAAVNVTSGMAVARYRSARSASVPL